MNSGQKIHTIFPIYPHNFQRIFFWELSQRHFWTKNPECGLGFLSENDASSVPKIRFFIPKSGYNNSRWIFCPEMTLPDVPKIPQIGVKFAQECPPTQTPTQKFESGFSIFSSQRMGPSLVSLRMTFDALQFDLFKFKFNTLG